MINWSQIKYWGHWTKQYLRKKYYSLVHGIIFDSNHHVGTLLPHLGENQFVKIKRKGHYLEITNQKNGDMIRLIPSRHSLGYMIECHSNEKGLIARTSTSFDDIWNNILGKREKKA